MIRFPRPLRPAVMGFLAMLNTGPVAGQALAPPPEVAPPLHSITDLVTVSEFVVTGGSLKPVLGTKRTCRRDQSFIQNALKTRNLTLKPCDYRAVFQQGRLDYPGRTSATPLEVGIYRVSILNGRGNLGLQAYLETLSQEAFQGRLLSAYEAPTFCYFFVSGGTLILLAHYGLPSYYPGLDIGTAIQTLKQEACTVPPKNVPPPCHASGPAAACSP